MTTDRLTRPSSRVLVLFGATGDLAARKLLPGLFHLYRLGLMPREFRIIGSGRHAPQDFSAHVEQALRTHGRMELDGHWQDFAKTLSFVASSAQDGSGLADAVSKAESEISTEGERLVYLSVPPAAMPDMIRMLGDTGIAENCSLVVEKPFGHDVASARELNAILHDVLAEESVYRIDHFLGKEPVQNILALRFANGIFEPIWNRDHIAYVQIDVPGLLHDVMLRDRLLFTRAEQIERLWEVCAPLLEHPPAVESYEKGSWGPQSAIELPEPQGWRLPDGPGLRP